jgi:hypothetical protein
MTSSPIVGSPVRLEVWRANKYRRLGAVAARATYPQPLHHSAGHDPNQSISALIPPSNRPFHTCMEILPTCNGFGPLRGASLTPDPERAIGIAVATVMCRPFSEGATHDVEFSSFREDDRV